MRGIALLDTAANTLWIAAAALVVLSFNVRGQPGLRAVEASAACLIAWFVLAEIVLRIKGERAGFLTRFVVTVAALTFLAVIGPVIQAAG